MSSYEHTMWVLETARNYCIENDERWTHEQAFACVLHDIGKIRSKEKGLENGSHNGHDSSDHFDLIEEFSEKCQLTTHVRKFCEHVIEFHMKAHYLSGERSRSIRTMKLVDMLTQIGRTNRTWVKRFAIVCAADSQCRNTKNEEEITQIMKLVDAYEIFRGVNGNDLRQEIRNRHRGTPKFGEQLRIEKRNRLKDWIKREQIWEGVK